MKKGETGTKTTGIWRLICLENFTFSLNLNKKQTKKSNNKKQTKSTKK